MKPKPLKLIEGRPWKPFDAVALASCPPSTPFARSNKLAAPGSESPRWSSSMLPPISSIFVFRSIELRSACFPLLT